MTVNTPLDNTDIDIQDLLDEPETEFKDELISTAKRIKSSEATLQRYLSELGKSTSGDLTKVVIKPNEILIRSPELWPAARRAKTTQQNLETHLRQYHQLKQQHDRDVDGGTQS